MTKHDTNGGFSIVEALLTLVVIGILGFTGWYVYHTKQTSDKNYAAAANTTVPTYKKKTTANATATIANPYAGWETYTSSKEGLSFKYPSTWKPQDDPCVNPATQVAGQCYQFLTPQTSASPYMFVVTYYWNQSAAAPFQGGETIKTVTPLNVHGSKTPLILVSYSINQLNSSVAGLALTDKSYTVGQTVSYIPNVTSQTQSGMSYTLTAVMKTPGEQDIPGYSLAQYQAQPDYNNVVKMFQSLSY